MSESCTDACPICGSKEKRKTVDNGPPYYGKFPKEIYEWECLKCGRMYGKHRKLDE